MRDSIKQTLEDKFSFCCMPVWPVLVWLEFIRESRVGKKNFDSVHCLKFFMIVKNWERFKPIRFKKDKYTGHGTFTKGRDRGNVLLMKF